MKREIFQEVDIPEGVEVEISGDYAKIKGPEGEINKKFNVSNIVFEKVESKVRIGNKKSTKREKKMTNTIAAHIRNMIKGVNEKYEYQLKICSSHFPITVEVNGNEATISNFLGEKIQRKTKIPEGVEVSINGDIITILSADKEKAGQAAANLEKSTRIRAKDRRIFQDGIFMIKKAGKEL